MEGQGGPAAPAGGQAGEAPGGWEAATNVAAQIIRKLSGEGRFAGEEDILEELVRLQLLAPEPQGAHAAMEEILAAALETHPDLVAVTVAEGTRYYSSRFMTESYACLLRRREGEPLHLIAETVRENSSLYPRPVPLGAFEQPPFSLTREEILRRLEQMAGREIYRDIARTSTSAGNEFLYSTAHLDPEYAAALAEWIDVGQYDNP